MKRALVVSSSFAVAFVAVTLHAAPAFAGDIFAIVTITNNSGTDFCVPDGDASVDGQWNPQGSSGGPLATSDGSPAKVLGHHQKMVFGSKANGGIWPSGTGGSLTIPLQPIPTQGACTNGTVSANFTWSAPWSYFNGYGGNCDGETSISQPNGFGTPFSTRRNSISTDGSSTLLVQFEIDGPGPTPMVASELVTGQSLARGTSSNHVTSADGSTTLWMADDGSIYVYDQNNGATWSNHEYTGVLASLGTDGNFVVRDVNDQVVWSTGTSGYPQDFLLVGPGVASVGEWVTSCFGAGFLRHCVNYENSLFTMQTVQAVNQ